jgi:hypothetical protein
VRFEPAKSSIEGLKATIRGLEEQVANLNRVRETPPLTPASSTDEVSWSTGSTVDVAVGDRKSFARSVLVSEFRMDLKGSISGTYTARLLKNGSPISGSTVTLTGAGCDYTGLAVTIAARPTDYIEAEITAVGSGATGMTLTAVYA